MKPEAIRYGLPPRMFLYTMDQLCTILQIDETKLHRDYLYHEGRDVGFKRRDQMECRNIAPRDQRPEWRVSEKELIRWMRTKGFKFYDRSTSMR